MRGQPQAASARLPAAVPARRLAAMREQAREKRQRRREERLEVIVRLRAEDRKARRSGADLPAVRRLC